MKNKLLLGSLVISRPSSTVGEEYVSIKITDTGSSNEFVEVRVSLADFTKAITGQYTECKFIPHKLEVVGKIKEQKELKFEIPNDSEREYAPKYAQLHTDEGWTASTYFGSQGSFRTIEGKRYAYGVQYRYVDETEQKLLKAAEDITKVLKTVDSYTWNGIEFSEQEVGVLYELLLHRGFQARRDKHLIHVAYKFINPRT